jgi:hypothetical protein
VAAIIVPIYLIQKGLDLVFSCLGNVLVVIVAGVLLFLYIVMAEVELCQVWLIGETICSMIGNS